MALVYNTHSCGAFEISALAAMEEKALLIEICRAFHTWTGDQYMKTDPTRGQLRTPAIVFYTCTVGGGYDWAGPLLERMVKTFKVGSITKSEPVINDLFHSSHKAVAYLWSINKQAMEDFWAVNIPEDLTKKNTVSKITAKVPAGLKGVGNV